MGTQQQLTTEQAELLVLIKEIEDFDKQNPRNIPPGGVKEILDGSNIMSPEKFDQLAKTLEYYGYLHMGDELTIDGIQYVELFQEYLQKKTENPSVEYVPFSLINIEHMEIHLFDSIAKISILDNVGKWPKLLQAAVKAIKGKFQKDS